MKLAEALALRSDQKKRLGSLSERIVRNAKVQEGDRPAEDPRSLLRDHDALLNEHEDLVVRINRTNLSVVLPDGRTLTAAIARRDSLVSRIANLRRIAMEASTSATRGLRTEIKFVATIDIAEVQREIDQVSKAHRELDTTIQSVNWTAELID